MALWMSAAAESHSPWASSYIYASVIFILMANLCSYGAFKPALYSTAFIARPPWLAAYVASLQEAPLFLLTFSPIALFSLYISWSKYVVERAQEFPASPAG